MVLSHFLLDFDIKGKRILEVGCGIGLASLLLNHRLADITATDYHPESGPFLKQNVDLNDGEAIPFFRTGWEDDDTGVGKFDLIVGSDVLYEHELVDPLATFVDRHCSPGGEVILVDPGRGLQARFSKIMEKMGYEHSQSKPVHTAFLTKPYKGQILRYRKG